MVGVGVRVRVRVRVRDRVRVRVRVRASTRPSCAQRRRFGWPRTAWMAKGGEMGSLGGG